MKKGFIGCILGFMLLSTACSSNPNDIQVLKEEVIVIHDEVMPLMDPLYNQRQKLQQKMKEGGDSLTLQKLILEIKEAEEGMMRWMRQYEPDFEGKTKEETLAYLQSQKEQIQKVNQEMKEALQKSKETLAQP